MGYFVGTSGSHPTTGTSLIRRAITVGDQQFAEHRLSLGALTSEPQQITIDIRGIGRQWLNQDFRVRLDSGETWFEWDQPTDGMHDIVRAGDTFLIEFTL